VTTHARRNAILGRVHFSEVTVKLEMTIRRKLTRASLTNPVVANFELIRDAVHSTPCAQKETWIALE
jgi:hypothetical protein